MTETARNRLFWLWPLVFGLMAAGASFLACWRTLGLHFGYLTLVCNVLPPLAARHRRPRDMFITAAALIVPCLLLTSPLRSVQAALIAVAVITAQLGLLLILRRVIFGSLAAPLTTIVTLAWLAWPIWLSHWLTPRTVNLFAPVHPLLALNRVFIDLGIWTQAPLMYQLTALGQDVPYGLPATILPCVGIHTLMGASLGMLAWWLRPAESSPLRSAASPAP
jgi:hypothetical protein